jgi:hypothetical protein
MAKQKSFIKIQGTFGGMTSVNSKAYGEHLRSPRGTHKPAKLNNSFTESKGALVASNAPAKLIKNSLDPYRANFYDGRLWTRLVSHFKTGKNKPIMPGFLSLVGFEVHSEHPLSKIASVEVDLVPNYEKAELQVTIQGMAHGKFRNTHIDGCVVTVIGISPDLTYQTAYVNAVVLPVIPLKEDFVHQITLPFPDEGDDVLICIKAEGCEKGQVSGVLKTKGMQIVKGIKLGAETS